MADTLKGLSLSALSSTEAYYIRAMQVLYRYGDELRALGPGAGATEVGTALTRLVDASDALRKNLESGLREVSQEIKSRR